MRRFPFLFLMCAMLLFFSPSCGDLGMYSLLFDEDDVEERYTSFAQVAGPDVSGLSRYSGVIITDVHFGGTHTRHDDEFVAWFAKQYESADTGTWPRFIFCLGDIVERGWKGEFEDYNALLSRVKNVAKEKLGLSSADDFPVYTVLGNHDLYNNGLSYWTALVSPHTSSFYFDVGSFRFIGLDTGNGSLGGQQLKDFERLVASDSRPKVVGSHYPIYSDGIFVFNIGDTYERNRIIAAFAKGNVKQVLEGHHHEYQDSNDFGFGEHVVGGYLDYSRCAVVTMDESDNSVSYRGTTFD